MNQYDMLEAAFRNGFAFGRASRTKDNQPVYAAALEKFKRPSASKSFPSCKKSFVNTSAAAAIRIISRRKSRTCLSR